MTDVDLLMRERMKSEKVNLIEKVAGHLINAGGKRLRPLLTIASAKLFNYQGIKHIKLAAVVEFIHNATLLHDDVVDKSDRRRDRRTANSLWDNKTSILVGDFLFSRAFKLMIETNSPKVLSILANTSAMISEGEVLQLSIAKNLNTTEETYYDVILRNQWGFLGHTPTAVFYIISIALIGFHLKHGFQSALKTFGLSPKSRWKVLYGISFIFWGVIPLLFIVIVLAIQIGLIS